MASWHRFFLDFGRFSEVSWEGNRSQDRSKKASKNDAKKKRNEIAKKVSINIPNPAIHLGSWVLGARVCQGVPGGARGCQVVPGWVPGCARVGARVGARGGDGPGERVGRGVNPSPREEGRGRTPVQRSKWDYLHQGSWTLFWHEWAS